MKPKDLNDLAARLDRINADLRACRHEVQAAPANPRTAHYDAVLADIEGQLPQVLHQYRASAAELPLTAWTHARQKLRGPAVRAARPLDRRVHDLRHDFLEIVHPLEVVGKWPPELLTAPAPEAAASAEEADFRDLPDFADADEPPGRLRSTGKWPPDPD